MKSTDGSTPNPRRRGRRDRFRGGLRAQEMPDGLRRIFLSRFYISAPLYGNSGLSHPSFLALFGFVRLRRELPGDFELAKPRPSLHRPKLVPAPRTRAGISAAPPGLCASRRLFCRKIPVSVPRSSHQGWPLPGGSSATGAAGTHQNERHFAEKNGSRKGAPL